MAKIQHGKAWRLVWLSQIYYYEISNFGKTLVCDHHRHFGSEKIILYLASPEQVSPSIKTWAINDHGYFRTILAKVRLALHSILFPFDEMA